MIRTIVILGLAVGVVGCGASNVVTPSEVAQNYVYAVAEGNGSGACALLDARTRDTLVASTRSRRGCPALFARCLPKGSAILRRDQSQLLYANVDLRVSGAHADVRLSGTAAAKATKEVMLAHERTRWVLTSPGQFITRCVSRLRRSHRPRHRRRSRGG